MAEKLPNAAAADILQQVRFHAELGNDVLILPAMHGFTIVDYGVEAGTVWATLEGDPTMRIAHTDDGDRLTREQYGRKTIMVPKTTYVPIHDL